MNLKLPSRLLNATRLVRGGKLTEATEMIQRVLRGGIAPPAPEAAAYAGGEVIEGFCRVVEPSAPSRPRTRFTTRSYSNAAGTREYKIYVPARAGQALPLVVMLHGCRQAPDDFAAATRMNLLAEEHGFVVVYPCQISKANASNCWNWFEGTHQERERGEPSLIAGITREALATHGLDSRRVYVAGLSAGGAMAVVMATTYPELYAAAGVHSGLPYAVARDVPSAFAAMSGKPAKSFRKGRSDVSHSVPIIVFHGDNDTTVHPSNGDDVVAQVSPGSAPASAAVSGVEPTVEHGDANGRAYTRTTHFDAAGKPVIEQWLVHGAAHAWSGGSVEGSFSDPAGPDASREMVRFFLQHENTQ